uniref:Uncharacterized protein n=1 Tax=Meloidogyne javanica TaxID=6303 RepID=A0A915M757_MELJA
MSSSSGSVKDNKNGVVRADAGWKQVDISSKSFMVSLNGRKNRLFMTMLVCKNLKDILDKLEKDGRTAVVPKVTTEGKDNTCGVIHTETIINDRRRYYIDLRENHRGIFLRVTQFDIQTGNRNSVVLPLQGVCQFRDALKEIIDEFGEGYIEQSTVLPKSHNFRTDGKNFFFDPGHNSRGDFLKITELKPSVGVRNTIALSVEAIPQFTQILNKLHQDFQTLRTPQVEVMRGDNGDGLSLGAVLSRSVTALVEDATEMADREAANALYELDMREWEGADLPVHHLRFRGLQRAATSRVLDGLLTVRKIENVGVPIVQNSKPKLPIVVELCGEL